MFCRAYHAVLTLHFVDHLTVSYLNILSVISLRIIAVCFVGRLTGIKSVFCRCFHRQLSHFIGRNTMNILLILSEASLLYGARRSAVG